VEYGRRHADLPLAGVACSLTPAPDGTVAQATLVYAGIGERPWRAPAADLLSGVPPTTRAFADVARAAAQQSTPHDDARASAAYRRRLVQGLTLRALARAGERAGYGEGGYGDS
jgi:carbon-monoxide dehydrogenase medium subunit